MSVIRRAARFVLWPVALIVQGVLAYTPLGPWLVRLMASTGWGTDRCLAAGCLPMPVHFYSPVPDIPDLAGRKVWSRRSDLPGIDFRAEEQVALLRRHAAAHGAECIWPRHGDADGPDFFVDNNCFGFGCAASTHCVLRAHKPARVIEIGSGMSSRVIAAALARNAAEGRPAEHTIVDPYPSAALRRHLGARARIVESRVELLAPDFFAQLGEDDVLFIDSGHTVRIGGDVNFLYLDVLPRLRPGVVIHSHDIPMPYEYPEVYSTNPAFRVFWTESYLLQAFLACNREFEVMLGLAYLMTDRRQEFREAFPQFAPFEALAFSSSFWYRRLPAAEPPAPPRAGPQHADR